MTYPWYSWWFRNPARKPPDMYKTLKNNGRNYQPQLVNAGFPPSTVSSLSSLPCHRTKDLFCFSLRLVGWNNLQGPISARLGIWDVYTPNFSLQAVRVCFFFPASVFCWNRFHPVSVSIEGVRRDPGIQGSASYVARWDSNSLHGDLVYHLSTPMVGFLMVNLGKIYHRYRFGSYPQHSMYCLFP